VLERAERGRGRFFGSIAVDADASGTDAKMRADALVLSRDAYLESVRSIERPCSTSKAVASPAARPSA